MTACVLGTGMTGDEPGFAGGKNGMTDKVLYTVSETVSHNRPRMPLPRWLIMEAALVLRRSFKA